MSPKFEQLESRKLMSITLAPDGTLSIVGTSGNDVVEVTGSIHSLADIVSARLNGATQHFAYSSIKRVVINTSDGNDSVLKHVQTIGLGQQSIPSTINTGNGEDTITTRDSGVDVVYAGSHNDKLINGRGDDNYEGARDTAYGGGGDDELQILSFTYNLVFFFGESGNDLVQTGDMDSHVDFSGGTGTDRFVSHHSGFGRYIIDNVRNFGEDDSLHTDVEVLEIGRDHVTIVGSDGPEWIRAGAGSGSLFVDGGGGNDTIEGGSSEESVVLRGGSGDDVIRLRRFGFGTGEVFGDAGNDSLFGSSKNDSLFGGDGNDTMDGGLGGDLIDGGGWGADVVDYSKRTFPLYVNASDARSNDGYGDEHDNVLANVEVIHGGSHNDVIVGNAANNVLNGNGGNDKIYGGAGNDVITGGPGLNSLYGEAGNDTIFAKWGTKDLVDGGSGTDSAQVDNGLDSIFNIENFI